MHFLPAFEQPDIKMTLDKTALKPEQLTHIPDFENIPASTKRIKPLNNFLGQDRAKASSRSWHFFTLLWL